VQLFHFFRKFPLFPESGNFFPECQIFRSGPKFSGSGNFFRHLTTFPDNFSGNFSILTKILQISGRNFSRESFPESSVGKFFLELTNFWLRDLTS